MLIRLKTLSERQFASTNSANFDPFTSDRWQWIASEVAEQFGCWPSDVHTIEMDDGEELIAIAGEPVARMICDFGWRALVAA